MYLLYDLFQLRRASLRQALYVKRQVYQLSIQDLINLSSNDLKEVFDRARKHLSIEILLYFDF